MDFFEAFWVGYFGLFISLLVLYGIVRFIIWVLEQEEETNFQIAAAKREKAIKEREEWIKTLTPEETEETRLRLAEEITEGEEDDFKEECKDKNIVFGSLEEYDIAWNNKKRERIEYLLNNYSLSRLFGLRDGYHPSLYL